MIVYYRVNEAAHRIFTQENFHFHRVWSRKYFTSWIVAGDNLQCVDVFLSVKVALIEHNCSCGNYAEFSTPSKG